MPRRTMQLWYFATNRLLTNVDANGLTGVQELQLRADLAREHDVRPGEGEFIVKEDDQIINRLPIPE